MKERSPFVEVSITLRIAFVVWYWFPVMTIRSIFSFGPSATRKVTRRAPSASSVTYDSTDASIYPLFWHTSFNFFTDSFTFSSWKRDRSLTVRAARSSVESTSLFPSISTAPTIGFSATITVRRYPPGTFSESNVTSRKYPILYIALTSCRTFSRSSSSPTCVPIAFRMASGETRFAPRTSIASTRYPAAPTLPAPIRRRAAQRSTRRRIGKFPLTRRSSRRRCGSRGEDGKRPGRCASP